VDPRARTTTESYVDGANAAGWKAPHPAPTRSYTVSSEGSTRSGSAPARTSVSRAPSPANENSIGVINASSPRS
jgi:hypothetical protein